MYQESLLSDIHDSEIISINIYRSIRELEFILNSSNNTIIRIVFHDIAIFRINDVLFQNIISRLIIHANKYTNDEDVIYWINWISMSSNGEYIVAKDMAHNYLKQIKNNELTLFLLEPSWGAESAIICKSLYHEYKT